VGNRCIITGLVLPPILGSFRKWLEERHVLECVTNLGSREMPLGILKLLSQSLDIFQE